MPTHEEYWSSLQATICVRCVDGDGEGECTIVPTRSCPLKVLFPKVLEAVNSVYSHSIVAYEDLLRSSVCPECKCRSGSGRCELRDTCECALDRYFPRIVEVIEETQQRAHLSKSVWVH